MKRALITGVTGMDGSYLAESLLSKGYEVHGLFRSTTRKDFAEMPFLDQVELHVGDMTSQSEITRILFSVKPDEVYNLAAQSFVGSSWEQAVYTADVTGMGAMRVFEAARMLKDEYGEAPRIYQASTSEMFGNSPHPQTEITPFAPQSPYAAAKTFAHQMASVYRESFGLYIACGILFNHESPRRGEEFVTRKITKGVAEIVMGERQKITLGNLDAHRDWGYAPDYVEAMHQMLQLDHGADFVIGTGVSRSVREFVIAAFRAAGIREWEKHVETSDEFFRPAEVHHLCANAGLARIVFGWTPQTPFEDWVSEMVEEDIARLKGETAG